MEFRKTFLIVSILLLSCTKSEEVEIYRYIEKKTNMPKSHTDAVKDSQVKCTNCILYLVSPSQCFACLNELIEFIKIAHELYDTPSRIILLETNTNSHYTKIYKNEILNTYSNILIEKDIVTITTNSTSPMASIGLYIEEDLPKSHFTLSNANVTSIEYKKNVLDSHIIQTKQ